jgi:hypothetical protein
MLTEPKKNHGFCECISIDFGNDSLFQEFWKWICNIVEMHFQDFGNGFSIFGKRFSIFGNAFPGFWKWVLNFWK